MFTLIILIIFIVSFGGVVFMIAGKIPVLVQLPQNGRSGIRDYKFITETEKKIKEIYSSLKLSFRKQIFLHKFLSWLKCRVLKTEVWLDHLLHNIRKQVKEQNQNGKK